MGHYELGKAVVSRGYPVWMEKPPAPTAAHSDEVAEAAAEAGQHVQIGYNYRYTVGVRKAKELIDSGQFEPPKIVAVQWWLGEVDGYNYLQHYLCHAVDLLQYLAGPLQNMHSRKVSNGDRFYYVATFDTPSCIAKLEASNNMDLSGPWCRIDWLGQSGLLSCLGFEELTLIEGREEHSKSHHISIWPIATARPRPGHSLYERWGYVDELRHFAAAVRGEEEPQATIAEAATGMHIAETILGL